MGDFEDVIAIHCRWPTAKSRQVPPVRVLWYRQSTAGTTHPCGCPPWHHQHNHVFKSACAWKTKLHTEYKRQDVHPLWHTTMYHRDLVEVRTPADGEGQCASTNVAERPHRAPVENPFVDGQSQARSTYVLYASPREARYEQGSPSPQGLVEQSIG